MTSSSPRFGLIACALVLSLTACGASSGEDNAPTTSAKTETAPGSEPEGAAFCTQLSGVREHFALLNVSLATDWSKFGEAAKAMTAVKPPAELSGDWKTATDFYTHIAGMFDGVDFSDGKAVSAVLENELGPQTEAEAKQAEKAIAGIDAYAENACRTGTSTAPAPLTDACVLLTAADLNRIFPTGLPEPDGRTYGPDTMECIWESDAAEVSIMLAPLADFEREYLAKSTPLPVGEIDGLEGGNTYRGVLGIGRFDTQGHSVSFTHGTVGGFVSVRHGDDNSRPAEVGTASRLAKALVQRL